MIREALMCAWAWREYAVTGWHWSPSVPLCSRTEAVIALLRKRDGFTIDLPLAGFLESNVREHMEAVRAFEARFPLFETDIGDHETEVRRKGLPATSRVRHGLWRSTVYEDDSQRELPKATEVAVAIEDWVTQVATPGEREHFGLTDAVRMLEKVPTSTSRGAVEQVDLTQAGQRETVQPSARDAVIDVLPSRPPEDIAVETKTPPAAPPNAPPATSESSGPKWTQGRADEKIRSIRRDHAGIYADLLRRLNAGDRLATKEARRLFGRNQIAKRYGIPEPMVSKSSAWQAMSAELGLGQRMTVRPANVGVEVAIDNKAAPGPGPATAAGDAELAAMLAKLPQEERDEIARKYQSGEYTFERATEIIRCALDQAADTND